MAKIKVNNFRKKNSVGTGSLKLLQQIKIVDLTHAY